jgi:hypothetical protein
MTSVTSQLAMSTIPDRYAPWATQFQQELHVSRSINQSIALTAAAAIWALGFPAAAEATKQTQPHLEPAPAIISKDALARPWLDVRSNLFATLREYALLDNGWDSSIEDVAPSAESLFQAYSYVEKLPNFLPSPDVSVSSDGEVIVFWRETNFYADVSFRGNSQFTFFAKSTDKKLKGSQDFASVFSSSDKLATLLIETFETHEMQL